MSWNYGSYRKHKRRNSSSTSERDWSSKSPGRRAVNGQRNAPPDPKGEKHNPIGVNSPFMDGGPMATTPSGVTPNQGTGPSSQASTPPWARAGMNLENNSPYAQGSQSEFAQPTSISSLISSLLTQSQTDQQDFWKVWGMNKGANLNQAMNNSMGAFGVNTLYNAIPQRGVNPAAPAPTPTPAKAIVEPDGATSKYSNYRDSGEDRYRRYTSEQQETSKPSTTSTKTTSTKPTTTTTSTKNDNPTNGSGALDANPVYNPWSKGQGGDYNRNGPTPQQMLQPTMEAMSLANAFFAPQRMELAYQLGDMETDMRRLAVNLGRQVDDPILQAKLYKDASRATRALDVQQNTYANQMVENRRREETQNFQFYDNLAQNEHKLMLANQQFYDDLELRSMQLEMQNEQFNSSLDLQSYQTQLQNRQYYDNLDLQNRYYNLQNWQVANAANPLGGGGSAPAPAPASGGAAPQQQQETVSGMFNAMFR